MSNSEEYKYHIRLLKENGTWDWLVTEINQELYSDWQQDKADRVTYSAMKHFMFKILTICETTDGKTD